MYLKVTEGQRRPGKNKTLEGRGGRATVLGKLCRRRQKKKGGAAEPIWGKLKNTYLIPFVGSV